MTRFLLRQHTSTIYFKQMSFLSRNTFVIRLPFSKPITLSSFYNVMFEKKVFKQTLVRQEPLLLMPPLKSSQVSGLRQLTLKEYSLLEEQTSEGLAFREVLLILYAKVLFHAKDFGTIEGLRDNLFHIFEGTQYIKIPPLILKYMPEKRLIVYLQHLTVFVVGTKKFSKKDLEIFCGSDISCSSFTKVNISSLIEVSFFKHIFKDKLGLPDLKFHLINPDALIPQFNPLESKEITGQKNSDFLMECFLFCGRSYKIYAEVKTYSHSGIGLSRFSVYHGNFKGNHEKEINNVERGLVRFLKENPSVEHFDLYNTLLKNILEIKARLVVTPKEKVILIHKLLFDAVFNPRYKALQISICVDSGLDSNFDFIFTDKVSVAIEKEKHNVSMFKKVFAEDNFLLDPKEHKAIVDYYSEALFIEELTTLIKNGVYNLQDV